MAGYRASLPFTLEMLTETFRNFTVEMWPRDGRKCRCCT